MKVMKLGKDSYKVQLEKDELGAYGLDYASLDCKKRETLQLLSDTLNHISEQYIQHYMLGDMLVEFFPDAADGCFLYFNAGKTVAAPLVLPEQYFVRFQQKQDYQAYQIASAEDKQIASTIFLWHGRCYGLCPALTPSQQIMLGEYAEILPISAYQAALFVEHALDVNDEKTQTER